MGESLFADIFRAKVANMKDIGMKSEAEEDVGYPTLFGNFDYMNAYWKKEYDPADGTFKEYPSVGFTDGAYVTVIGRAGCGKSSFIMKSSGNIVRPYENSVIMEDSLEGGMTHERRRLLTQFNGEEYKKKCIIRNTGITAENFYERIKLIYDMKTENRKDYLYDTGHKDLYGNPIMKLQPTVYIMDSIAMIMPEKYVSEDELSGNMAATSGAKVVTQIFRTIVPMLKSANIILFVVNHILQDVQIGLVPKKGQLMYLKQGERIPKGNTVLYLSNNIIRLDDMQKLKPDEGFHIGGSLVEFTLCKSRSAAANRRCTLVFDYENGFDPWLSLCQFLKDSGLIWGQGANCYLTEDKDPDTRFSMKGFKELINTNEIFRHKFLEVVGNELKKLPTKGDAQADVGLNELASLY